MNILYFASVDFYQKPNPSFHLMKAMIDDILGAGHTVFYVGISFNNVEKHIPEDLMNNPRFKSSLVALKPVQKNRFIKRYLQGVYYAFKAKKHIKEYMKECEIVFLQSSSTVLYNTLLARCLGKKKRLVLNIQDMFPGSSIASGVMNSRLLQSLFYYLQRIAYSQADIIVAISEDMKLKLIEQGVSESKIRVILNWFDDRTVREVAFNENRFIKKHNLSNKKFYVQYAGTMGYVFDYRMVLEVASRLKEYRDIEFHMIGEGSQKELFISKVNEAKLNNIHFFPLEPQNMVSDVYSACDVCLIPLKHGIIGNSVPSKAGLLMACKRPIVTSVDEGCLFSKEICDSGMGFACADNDPDAVGRAILYIYNHREEGKEMGRRGYEFGHIRYARSTNMNMYLDLFGELGVSC